MWQNPKTTWKNDDIFLLKPDYERICCNLAVLQSAARPLYPDVAQRTLSAYTQADWATADFWNDMEDAVAALAATNLAGAFAARTFADNDIAWTAADANRIETACAVLHQNLQAQAKNLPRLQFTLGGGLFAAAI